MEVIRTPDECFENLDGYDFAPHYSEIDDGEGGTLRMHYLDEGPPDGEVVLMLHGNPSWAYLYRKMIPVFVAAGYRAVAPDLIGFGRSDKPIAIEAHTYSRHVAWLRTWIEQLDLTSNLFAQDWGGLIGLRVVAELPERFRRVIVGNTSLPDGGGLERSKAEAMRARYESLPVVSANELFRRFVEKSEAPGYWYWRKFCASSPEFRISKILAGDPAGFSREVLAANEAPYPDERYLAGPRGFPAMAPIFPDDPELERNREAWKQLATFDRPFRTAFSSNDYVAREGDEASFQERIPGARDVEHSGFAGMGHFLQEPEVAEEVVRFMQKYPLR